MTATQTQPVSVPAEPQLAAFERLIEPTAGGHPAWLFPLRKSGIVRFAELGFPTIEHEDWRFTNLAALARWPFRPVTGGQAGGVTAADLSGYAFSSLPGDRLVFVNGQFAAELSRLEASLDGIRICNLASALAKAPAFVEQHLGRYTKLEDNALAALNTAFFQDGVFIHVPDDKAVTDPVQVIHVSTGAASGAAISPRNLVVVGRNAKLTVLESYVALGDAACFTNAVTELAAGENANVEWVKLQDESHSAYHLSTLHAHLGRASNVSAHSFALGARLSRNNIRTKLAGPGLECVLNGLYLTRGEQLADHHMIVEHAEPHCASHEYFNGILDDKSKGVFHGRIYVHPIAQKTDAKQTNKNLLLSDDATADTKPQLEIYADDVKCTHGATIGQMNEESIFYLRSRGIGLARARRMLIHAFAGEIIDRVKCVAAREELDRVVWDRLESSTHLKDAE
jgi:Fe-S cluster assembly protein SufD